MDKHKKEKEFNISRLNRRFIRIVLIRRSEKLAPNRNISTDEEYKALGGDHKKLTRYEKISISLIASGVIIGIIQIILACAK